MAQNLLDKIGEVFTDPHTAWDEFRTGGANTTNERIANQNLDYQRERNAIEDARYEEERDYNRAWAEEERDYNRALQERIFDREDTALLRQAEQLGNLGINPLSQQMNGSDAGQVVSSASAPVDSARGGQSLHNDFKAQDAGVGPMLSALGSLADTVNGITTGTYNRDSIRLQNERSALENYVYAREHGVLVPAKQTEKYLRGLEGWNGYDEEYWNENYAVAGYDKINQKREYKGKQKYDIYDFESKESNMIKSLGNLDFVKLAENILTRGARVVDNIGSKFKKEYGTQSLLEKFFTSILK